MMSQQTFGVLATKDLVSDQLEHPIEYHMADGRCCDGSGQTDSVIEQEILLPCSNCWQGHQIRFFCSASCLALWTIYKVQWEEA